MPTFFLSSQNSYIMILEGSIHAQYLYWYDYRKTDKRTHFNYLCVFLSIHKCLIFSFV